MERLSVRPNLLELIQKVSAEQGLKKCKIVNVATNEKGEGFLSEIFLVDLTDEGTGKTLNLVIKAAFLDDSVRQAAPVRSSFENEVYFYREVYRIFKQFENGKQLNEDLIPKCFATSLDDHAEVLVLENMKARGFEMFPKTATVDDDHVRLLMKTYGRFHAYSFALKDQQPAVFETLPGKCHSIYGEFIKTSLFRNSSKGIVELVCSLLTPGRDDKIIKEFEKYRGEGGLDIFRETYTRESKFAAIVHGDCWSNNMMFKYELQEDRRKLSQICLLDFQLIKVGSPVCDLSYFLYSTGSKDIYDHLDEYLAIYRDSLCSCVREWGSDPDKLVFSFDELKEEWSFFSKFGFIAAIMVWKMKLTDKEDQIDFTDKERIKDENAFVNQRFNEELFTLRVREVLEHMSEIGAL